MRRRGGPAHDPILPALGLSWPHLAAAVLTVLLIDAALTGVLAQTRLFGVPRGQAPPPDGLTGWIMAKQAQYYRSLAGAVRAIRTDPFAVWLLFGISFGYGVFHAAGPGHGKAVISSYLIANDEAWRRGIVLSFASAMLQALVAVTLVGIVAVLLNATMCAMKQVTDWIEIASYGLIAALGAWLVWGKGRSLVASVLMLRRRPQPVGAAASDAHHHGHDHHHAHGHDHAHHHDNHCGHAHGPDPKDVAGPGGWRRGLTAIVAVGVRPCSGAILILVFTLAQGVFWAGVASTFIMALGTAITVAVMATLAVSAKGAAARYAAANVSYAGVALRAVELAAALFVLGFGLLLLTGVLASSERLNAFGASC